MHAYYRMEADQTDGFVVHATREEWRGVLKDFQLLAGRYPPGITMQASFDLITHLEVLGVYE